MRKGVIYLICMLSILLSGCGNEKTEAEVMGADGSISSGYVDDTFKTEPLVANGMNLEEISVTIPGLTQEYHFLFLADLHVIVENEEIAAKELETVRARMYGMAVSEEMTAAEYWGSLPEILDSCHADAVLLGGDMVDYCSTSNIGCLKEGLDRLETPYMYVRADHDSRPFYCEGIAAETCASMHMDVDGNEEVWCMELPELCIAGLSNSTSQISEAGVEQMKEIFAIGKPIILLTHVPYDSKNDASLKKASKGVWQDRALLWGEDCNYRPDENTGEFMDMIYADDSPVKEILCGHLHFAWDGYITENTHQHVFSPAFGKTVGVITVKGM